MRLGVSDYLLKPTLEPEDLREVLNKITRQIAEERKINAMYREKEQLVYRMKLERAWTKLLTGEADKSNPHESLPWLNKGYRIAVALLDGAVSFRSDEGGVFVEVVIDEVQESSWYGKQGGKPGSS